MIDLIYDVPTDTVKLARPATIKPVADVPVRVTFSTSPGVVSAIQLAIGTGDASPSLLAFTEAFSEENATTWTGFLDASDTRLVDYMVGRTQGSLNLELVCVIDGESLVAPNLALTVQPRIITGPTTSEGGPTYLTLAMGDGRYALSSDLTSLSGIVTATKTQQALAGYQEQLAASGTIVLSAGSSRTQHIEATGALTVQLPDVSTSALSAQVDPGWDVRITNIGASVDLTVASFGGITQAILRPGDRALCTATESGAWEVEIEPANQPFLIRKTSVPLTATGSTNIFTVPSGLTYVCTALTVLITNAASVTSSVASLNVAGSTSGSLLVGGTTTSGANAAGRIERFAAAAAESAAGGETVSVSVSAAASATALTATIILEGFYL